MNRQAFADIESITVRVEERRERGLGPGNWRVHEFSGFDAIPLRLRAAFAAPGSGDSHAVALDARIRETYQRRRQECRFDESYDIPGAEPGSRASVARTVTIMLRYRQRPMPTARAA